MPQESNKDFINRRVSDVETLFGMAVKDVKSLIVVLLIALSGYLFYSNEKKNRQMVLDNKEMSDRIIEEVKKQTTIQMAPIADTVYAVSREIKEKLKEDEKNKK